MINIHQNVTHETIEPSDYNVLHDTQYFKNDDEKVYIFSTFYGLQSKIREYSHDVFPDMTHDKTYDTLVTEIIKLIKKAQPSNEFFVKKSNKTYEISKKFMNIFIRAFLAPKNYDALYKRKCLCSGTYTKCIVFFENDINDDNQNNVTNDKTKKILKLYYADNDNNVIFNDLKDHKLYDTINKYDIDDIDNDIDDNDKYIITSHMHTFINEFLFYFVLKTIMMHINKKYSHDLNIHNYFAYYDRPIVYLREDNSLLFGYVMPFYPYTLNTYFSIHNSNVNQKKKMYNKIMEILKETQKLQKYGISYLHRDLTLSNIMVTNDDELLLIDHGLSMMKISFFCGNISIGDYFDEINMHNAIDNFDLIFFHCHMLYYYNHYRDFCIYDEYDYMLNCRHTIMKIVDDMSMFDKKKCQKYCNLNSFSIHKHNCDEIINILNTLGS